MEGRREGRTERGKFTPFLVHISRRWLRVCQGELLYFRPDDLEVRTRAHLL